MFEAGLLGVEGAKEGESHLRAGEDADESHRQKCYQVILGNTGLNKK